MIMGVRADTRLRRCILCRLISGASDVIFTPTTPLLAVVARELIGRLGIHRETASGAQSFIAPLGFPDLPYAKKDLQDLNPRQSYPIRPTTIYDEGNAVTVLTK